MKDFAKKRLSIVGSTGSIGLNTLDIVARHPDRFEVVGLACGRNIQLLAMQIKQFQPKYVAVFDSYLADELVSTGVIEKARVLFGKDGYKTVAALNEADIMVSAMVGAAGLVPTMAAIKAGKDVALANKESLVVAGSLVTEAARKHKVKLLPVDSEHSAIFQCLEGRDMRTVKRLVLTASGGPFFRLSVEEMAVITPAQAVKHPKWSMGKKISVDSATLINKGLELIEASWLFDCGIERLGVVIHPQSIVHSMVEFVDGSIISQMGAPDMRIPISYALSYPDRLELGFRPLDLVGVSPLEFFEPDMDRFPCLRLAIEAANAGGVMPVALNAANEVAVEAFLAERLSFAGIAATIAKTLEGFTPCEITGIDDIYQADALARLRADEYIESGIY